MAPGPARHTVVSGETLAGIARRFGTSVQALAQLNNIKDVDRIRVGLVLRLPSRSVQRLAAQRTYTVRAGDTLSDIAVRFGTTVAKLASLNGIKNADAIPVGFVLRLPSPQPQRPPSPQPAGAVPREVDGPVEALPPGGGVSGKQLLVIMPTLARSKGAAYLPFLDAA